MSDLSLEGERTEGLELVVGDDTCRLNQLKGTMAITIKSKEVRRKD